MVAKPPSQQPKAVSALATLDLGHKRGLVHSKCIDVDVVPLAAKTRGTGKRVPLGVYADVLVELDDLALNRVAFRSVLRTTHVVTSGSSPSIIVGCPPVASISLF